MRTFFLQMFLAFWVSTIGIFFVATALNPDGRFGSPENIRSLAAKDALNLSTSLVASYKQNGCDGIRWIGQDYLITDKSANLLCGSPLSSPVNALVRDALSQNTPKAVHDADFWVMATPITLNNEKFAVVHREPYQPRPSFPRLPPVALPVSLLVTFFFAFILTRPVRSLSKAFARFSEGDLAVRMPVTRRAWSFLGGSDVRSLMVDFNHMGDRISSLVEGQKTLIRDISHELRSPLARLRLALEMARETPSQAPTYLDQMETEAERVNDLIGQMLTLSLMESTGEITDKEHLDLVELIEALIPDLAFEAAASHCTVRLSRPPQGIFVDGDAELLRRAIENIARNAIRFTAPSTEISIALSIQTFEERETVVIDVCDRGPGVPQESLKLLFRAFYRTDAARRDSTGGFGVGLSIAERAIALHGGSIVARNRDGGGLIVSVHLPLAS